MGIDIAFDRSFTCQPAIFAAECRQRCSGLKSNVECTGSLVIYDSHKSLQ